MASWSESVTVYTLRTGKRLQNIKHMHFAIYYYVKHLHFRLRYFSLHKALPNCPPLTVSKVSVVRLRELSV